VNVNVNVNDGRDLEERKPERRNVLMTIRRESNESSQEDSGRTRAHPCFGEYGGRERLLQVFLFLFFLFQVFLVRRNLQGEGERCKCKFMFGDGAAMAEL
jgi:hypothetical protein